MKLLNKFKQALRVSSKRTKVLISGVLTLSILFTGVAFAGWTPNRPVYDWNNPADRKGSMDGPRLNAFINTPGYGDERAFYDARVPGDTSSKDVLNNVDSQKEVILRTFVHNGANQDTNASGKGIAKDTKVRITLPTGTETALRSRSYLSISNPAPNYPAEVTDTAELVGAKPFSISYIPGSAKIMNNAKPGGMALSDNIVSSGAPIGYDALNGNVPGCFEFAAFIEIKVKINVPETDIQKQVKKVTDSNYGELATVKPGDKVQWLIRQDMKGSAKHDNVRVFDALPNNLTVVPGSVRWVYKDINGNEQDIVISDTSLFTKQVDFGSWDANTFFYLRFDTIAKGDFEGCEVLLTNQARSNTKQSPSEQRDSAQVKIVKENCNSTVHKFNCDSLTAQKLSRTSFKFTASGSAENATITGYQFFVNGNSVQDSASNMYTLNQSTPGDYKVHVIVKTDKGNTQESEVCTKTVTVEQEEEEPKYACDLLTLTSLGDRKVKFSVDASASGGAVIKRYIYNFGDGTEALTTDKNMVEYQYQKDGTFNSSVQVVVEVNGQEKIVTGNNCTGSVTFFPPECKDNPRTPENECKPCVDNPKTEVNECKPTTPTIPTTLPNTGPGDVIAAFFSVTVGGMVAYQMVVRRFLGV